MSQRKKRKTALHTFSVEVDRGDPMLLHAVRGALKYPWNVHLGHVEPSAWKEPCFILNRGQWIPIYLSLIDGRLGIFSRTPSELPEVNHPLDYAFLYHEGDDVPPITKQEKEEILAHARRVLGQEIGEEDLTKASVTNLGCVMRVHGLVKDRPFELQHLAEGTYLLKGEAGICVKVKSEVWRRIEEKRK